MKHFLTCTLALVVAVSLAPSSIAQNYPLPRSEDEAPVLCTGCPDVNSAGQPNDGLPTVQYAPPLVDFVGRTVDSNAIQAWPNLGFRTARAKSIIIAEDRLPGVEDRIYFAFGEAIAGYSTSTMFSRLYRSGNAANWASVKDSPTKASRPNGIYEQYTKADVFMYPEKDGWIGTSVNDAQYVRGGWDVDDRGYIYAAYSVFGWGIVKDAGQTGMTLIKKVAQVNKVDSEGVTFDPTDVAASTVLVIPSNSKYYAVIGANDGASALWDVTTPTAPVYKSKSTDPRWLHKVAAKNQADGVVAVASGKSGDRLRIFTYDNFVSGGSAIVEFPADAGKWFSDAEFDEDGVLWVVQTSSGMADHVLWRIAPSGNTYTKTVLNVFSPKQFLPIAIGARDGWIAIAGEIRDGVYKTYNVQLFKLNGSTPQFVNTNDYFKKYYHRAPANYAEPGAFVTPDDIKVYKSGNKTYLIYHASGMGDVYELEGGDSISVSMRNDTDGDGYPYGEENPHATPEQDGPFPGDPVIFRAEPSNPAASYSLDWNFGNTEAGVSDNQREGATKINITHRFTGLNTSAKITSVKNVTATAQSDNNINDAFNVTLKVPVARIAIETEDGDIPVTGSGFEVVAGEKFVDASDGSVESHFATWTVAGNPAQKARPDTGVPVGTVGDDRTVSFSASYGKYDEDADPSTFSISSPYIASVSTKTYDVKAMIATVNPPTRSGEIVTFTGTGRYSRDPAVLSATQWNVKWTLTTGAAVGSPQAQAIHEQGPQTVAIGTIPDFEIDKDLLGTTNTITLEVSVDPGDIVISPAPPGVGGYTDNESVALPDPKITVTPGTCNAGSPCTLTVSSDSGASIGSWDHLWVVKLGNTTKKSGTTNPIVFTPDVAGSYTVTYTEKVFDINEVKNFTVEAPACSPVPDVSSFTLGIDCPNGCDPNKDIEFTAGTWHYTFQDCDKIEFDFGDGSPKVTTDKTERTVLHKYTSSGTKTVKMRVYNSASGSGVTRTETVSISGGGGGTCPAPGPISITTNCGGNCETGQSIKLTAKQGAGQSLAACHTTAWTIEGKPSTSTKSPSISYTSPGSYDITVVVASPDGGSETGETTITVVEGTGGGGDCPGPAASSNITLAVSCPGGDENCQTGEDIEFKAGAWQYSWQGCEEIEFDFGDGEKATTDSGNRTLYHQYGTNGSYTVVMTVRTDDNPTGVSVSKTISIGGAQALPTPELSYSTFSSSTNKGSTVTFTVTSNIPATGWVWNFGDGSGNDSSKSGDTGTTSTITHKYTKTGTFTVLVKARNAADIAAAPTGQVSRNITVNDAPEFGYQYLLPAVIHNGGAGGSVWRTDVQVYNPDPNVSADNPLVMVATFKGQDYPLSLATATHVYEDFLGTLLSGQNEQGSVVIRTNAQYAPQIWTRTYTQTAGGTFGQFIPAILLVDGGGAAAVGPSRSYLAGLRNDDRYRTNIGLINLGPTSADLSLRVYTEDGEWKKDFIRTVASYTLDTFSIKENCNGSATCVEVQGLPAGESFRIDLVVPEGKYAHAFASIIDGSTTDPVTIEAVRADELQNPAYRSITIPGVGRLPQGAGAWQSDVTIFNPDTEISAPLDLEYYNAAGTLVKTAHIVLRDGGVLQYRDIIAEGVFGSEVPPGVGTLKIRLSPDLPNTMFPMAFARTYFENGGSSYGQGVSGFAPTRTYVGPAKPAIIAALRNDEHYYSNVGLLNVSDVPTMVRVTVLHPTTGQAVKMDSILLAPNQSYLAPIDFSLGLTSATLKFEVIDGGHVWAYASVLDRQTKDPEYVPATALQ